jgi:hypothetical protein
MELTSSAELSMIEKERPIAILVEIKLPPLIQEPILVRNVSSLLPDTPSTRTTALLNAQRAPSPLNREVRLAPLVPVLRSLNPVPPLAIHAVSVLLPMRLERHVLPPRPSKLGNEQ